jgi:glutaredoxin
LDRFDGVKAQVLGLSVDSVPCLSAWAESLGGINYPLLSDFYPHGEVAELFGVFRSEGIAERALFVIDRQGVIRYVDVHDIGQQPDNEELFACLAELEPESRGAEAYRAPLAEEIAMPEADVVMYCTPWCPDCRRARAYLRERGIEFVEVDISRDRAAAKRVRAWAGGNETTPTFDIRGTIVVEFDRARLDQLFGS